ncbi:hypothetical protein [Scytonema sp. NUACC21]
MKTINKSDGRLLSLSAVNSKDTQTQDMARQLAHHFGDFRTQPTTQQPTFWSNHEQQILIQQAVEALPTLAETAKIHLDWTPFPVWVILSPVN